MNNLENALVERLHQRDETVIGDLYDRYGAALYGVVVKIVNNEHTAEDVLQDAFTKIWQNGQRYDRKKGTLFTWMLNITRNTAIDRIRSAQHRQKIQPIDISVYNNPSLQTSPSTDTIGLRKIVSRLEPKYRMMIDLAYFGGYTHKEIEEKLNLPLGTIKSRLRIAMRELRKLVLEKPKL